MAAAASARFRPVPWLLAGLLLWCLTNARWTFDHMFVTSSSPNTLVTTAPAPAGAMPQLAPLAAELQRVLDASLPSPADVRVRETAQRFLVELARAGEVPTAARVNPPSASRRPVQGLRRREVPGDPNSRFAAANRLRRAASDPPPPPPAVIGAAGHSSASRAGASVRPPPSAGASSAAASSSGRTRSAPPPSAAAATVGGRADGAPARGGSDSSSGASTGGGVVLRVNEDFELYEDLRARQFNITPELRIELQMARLRKLPIFGILENKLLAHSLLHSLGVPTMDVAYGALTRAQLGEWATYAEPPMRAALNRAHGWGSGAVLKPATDGGNVGTILLSGSGLLPNGSKQFWVEKHDGLAWRRSVESRIGPKGGFGLAPGKLRTLK